MEVSGVERVFDCVSVVARPDRHASIAAGGGTQENPRHFGTTKFAGIDPDRLASVA